MIELSAGHFDELCRTEPVLSRIGSIEADRKQAVKQFWMRLLGTLAGTLATLVLLIDIQAAVAIIASLALLVGGVIWAWVPLNRAKEGLKLPVLEALAEQAGLTYRQDNFDPPVFGEAQPALFGAVSSATFSDLFYGKDEEDRNFAFYEATLTRQVGKNSQEIFSGQIYALQRRGGGQGTTAIVPDRGLFNFFKPATGMQRVKFEDHPEFEKRFEVYATVPAEASFLLASRSLRDSLLEARGDKWGSRLLVYLTPSDAFVAIQGPNRFEPGSMFSSRGGEERVRRMFDEVCDSMAVLRRLKAAFD